jgi:two-component system sensor histidine kinase UhpB
VNRHACESLGYREDELIGKLPTFIDPDITPALFAHRRDRLAAGESISFDALHSRKDGSTFPVGVRIRPFWVEGKRFALSLAHDISDRVAAQDALRQYADTLRDLSRRIVHVQEEERCHIARELHDEIGQTLSIVSVNLQSIQGDCNPSLGQRLSDCITIVNQAIEQVRSLSLDLRPPMLDDLGLVATLRWCAERVAAGAGFNLHFGHRPSGVVLSPEVSIACYRLAQEALNNVVKHARATNVWLMLQESDYELTVSIRDDGVGFDLLEMRRQTAQHPTLGLRSMEERAHLLGGRLWIESKRNQGTTVTATLPLSSGAY